MFQISHSCRPLCAGLSLLAVAFATTLLLMAGLWTE